MGQQGAFIEVHRRIGHRPGDVRIRSQMDDGVAPGHGFRQQLCVRYVPGHDGEPVVVVSGHHKRGEQIISRGCAPSGDQHLEVVHEVLPGGGNVRGRDAVAD